MMNLSYDALKKDVIKVEVLKDLNMGEDAFEILMDQFNGLMPDNPNYGINENDELIIPKGAIGELNVQTANYHYEIHLGDNISFDICFDDDNELNECVKGLEIIKPNKYFMNKA